ncbi:MAG: hypothetical protein GWN71_08845, partial [Gammaproteobacteria bacterium]|nr:hypothetical protein [Gemmatimonadota bacterium]NIU73670.1 hypothetical protein [Gammaproteobacteria bacterium]NIX23774.1 hypothetical protein [Actinomycetota bacterium]
MPIEDDSPVQRRSSLPSDRRGPTSGVGPPPGRVTVRDPSGPRIRWDIVGLAFLVVAVLFSSQNVIGAIAA